jgi:CHAT domain-containing protein/tetratricopeptide (TPR) repeat protein
VNLGDLLAVMGDYSGARAVLERALVITQKGLDPDHPRRAAVLWALADLGLDVGAPAAEVEPLLLQALAIRERALGPDHPKVAYTLASLATLAQRTGDDARARQALERACAILERSLGPEHPDLVKLLMELGKILERSTTPEQARGLFERAVAISERSFGAVHPVTAASRAALSGHLARAGDTAAALEAALEAEEAARQHVRLTVRSLGERQALSYSAARASSLDLAVSLLADFPREAAARRRDVLDTIVRSRALVLDEMAARQRAVATSGDAEIEQLAHDVAQARERLANVVVRGPGEGSPDRYRRLLDELRRDKERAEEALAARSLAFREEQSRAAVGLDEVEKALPAGATLIAFVRYAPALLATAPMAAGAKRDASYAAFVLKAGQDPEIVPLGRAEQVDQAVAPWQRELQWEAQAPGFAPRRSLERYMEAATALRRRIWDPLAPLLAGTNAAFVVPDGALHLVNLAALPLGDGRFLLEAGPLLYVLSAERDLVGASPAATGNGLLLMGAPDFASGHPRTAAHAFRGATSKCEGFERLRFSSLPAARREIKAISALWRENSGSRAGAASALVLEGAAANEAAFKDRAPGRRLLHLATHGFVLGEQCAATAGNPLLRSGLALAGANRRDGAGPDVEDGILTAEEIAALDLSGVEWAVLSACDTGLGDVTVGEGVLGLRRAFQIAGARSVIMSLWPVDDESARIWMGRLYRRHVQDGLGTAEAVRRASLDVLRLRRARGASAHPFYWAGFLAAGDWR